MNRKALDSSLPCCEHCFNEVIQVINLMLLNSFLKPLVELQLTVNDRTAAFLWLDLLPLTPRHLFQSIHPLS